MSFPAIKPLYTFTDIDGSPLNDGYLYFGTANADPQASPITVYWDSAQTQVVTQPVRTIGGYPVNAGVRAIVYVPGDYSINVRNKNGTLISTSPSEIGDNPFVFIQSGTGAVARLVQDKLRETISVFDFMTAAQIADVQAGTWSIDVTAAVNSAITAASSRGANLYIPAGLYKIIPATLKTDEAGSNLCAFTMVSNMHIKAEPGATFKIANNISTDASPTRMSMFFSNAVLHDLSFEGLTMDMNGANNLISPNRATGTFNNFTQAHIIFSGTPSGVAAKGTDVLIDRCKLINTAGVSCIVMGQTNTIGADFGTRWTVSRNVFYNNGTDCNDHSSVYAWALNVDAYGNTFENPAPSGLGNQPGGKCAYEIHCSNARFYNNAITNYLQGIWISQNNTEGAVRNVNIYGNTAKVSATFSDFYSSNLVFPWYLSESPHEHVNIFGNTIEITNDAVDEQVKVFFKIAARKQPKIVNIYGNTCRSYETTKEVAMCMYVVSPDQLLQGTDINVYGNTGAGLTIGMDIYFGGSGASLDIGTLSFKNNDLGVIRTSPINLGIYDVYLYGPSAGRVDKLVLGGLQTPLQPVKTDGAVGGRATVYGKALLTLPVTWNGITVGNGTTSARIGLDTDSGFAAVNLYFSAGTTSTAAGFIYPSIAGLSASGYGVTSAQAVYGSTPYPMIGEINDTGTFIQPKSGAGNMTDASPAAFSTTTKIYVAGNFPCASASI